MKKKKLFRFVLMLALCTLLASTLSAQPDFDDEEIEDAPIDAAAGILVVAGIAYGMRCHFVKSETQ